jgi:hypothetical protein
VPTVEQDESKGLEERLGEKYIFPVLCLSIKVSDVSKGEVHLADLDPDLDNISLLGMC